MKKLSSMFDFDFAQKDYERKLQYETGELEDNRYAEMLKRDAEEDPDYQHDLHFHEQD